IVPQNTNSVVNLVVCYLPLKPSNHRPRLRRAFRKLVSFENVTRLARLFCLSVIGLAMFKAVPVNQFIVGLIATAGAIQLISVFESRNSGTMLRRVVFGCAYLFLGLNNFSTPLFGPASTILLTSFLVIDGVLDLLAFFRLRSASHRNTAVALEA